MHSLLTIQHAKHQDKKAKGTSWFIQRASLISLLPYAQIHEDI